MSLKVKKATDWRELTSDFLLWDSITDFLKVPCELKRIGNEVQGCGKICLTAVFFCSLSNVCPAWEEWREFFRVSAGSPCVSHTHNFQWKTPAWKVKCECLRWGEEKQGRFGAYILKRWVYVGVQRVGRDWGRNMLGLWGGHMYHVLGFFLCDITEMPTLTNFQ